jgi:hypothetical protein
MSTQKQKCVQKNNTQLLYWPIFECLNEFWGTWQKLQGRVWPLRGLTTLTRVLTMPRCVDLLKMVMGDCWLGFRGDDPG